jgi:cytochrome c biogenesis protein CcmG/thiol:disulfide interchange protein DsbE
LLLGPLVVAAAGGGALYVLLQRMRAGTYDPRLLPSALVGRPMPTFDLPGLKARAGFSSRQVVEAGGPLLINFFASWCAPCAEEAPELGALHRRGVPIWGIAYKDEAAAAAVFLARHGDPYMRVAQDRPGRVGIDFGLYGVPETYLVDRSGVVRWRWTGALTPEAVRDDLDPLLKAWS